MANEGKAVFALSATGGVAVSEQTIRFDWLPSQGCDCRYHSVGTTEESVVFTDITTNGMVQLTNHDATNYVEVGFSATVYGIRIKPGGKAQFQLNPGATIYVKANTAACRLQVLHLGGV